MFSAISTTSLSSHFFIIVLLLTPYHQVFGNGVMCSPRQRGAYRETGYCRDVKSFKVDKFYVPDQNAHKLNGGGVKEVQFNIPSTGWEPYDPTVKVSTTRRAGLCGDKTDNLKHMIGGFCMPYTEVPIMATWKSGSVIDIEIGVHHNRNGFFEFHLCDLDSCGTPDIDESCFKQGHCHKLIRVPNASCESPNETTILKCGPVDETQTSKWFLPCRNNDKKIQFLGGQDGSMRFQLPEGVVCNHCVLQFYWATANRCNPPGFAEYFKRYSSPFGTTCEGAANAIGGINQFLETCSHTVPEEFFTCSDVQISEDGAGLGPVIAKGNPSPIYEDEHKCGIY